MEKITGEEKSTGKIETYFDFADSNHEKVYGNTFSDGGMTIRQHFAMIAMQGLLSGNHKCTSIHKTAVSIADNLIEELNNTPNPNL